MVEHYVYKYVKDGEVIYIGKTDSSLKQRISYHGAEAKFQEYAPWDIYYVELENSIQTDGFERLLIDLYQPVLNIRCKQHRNSTCYQDTLSWKPYSHYKAQNKASVVNENSRKISAIKGRLTKLNQQYLTQCARYKNILNVAEHLLFDPHDWDTECVVRFDRSPCMGDRFTYETVEGHRVIGFVFSREVTHINSTGCDCYYNPRMEENATFNTRDLYLRDYQRLCEEALEQLNQTQTQIQNEVRKLQLCFEGNFKED